MTYHYGINDDEMILPERCIGMPVTENGTQPGSRNGTFRRSGRRSPKQHLRESQTDSINPQVIKADFMKTATQSDHAVRI